MSSQPIPLPTLEYSTPRESSAAPLVRIIAIAGMVWGTLIALQGAGLLLSYYLQTGGRYPYIRFGPGMLNLQGLIGVILIPAGIGWMRGGLLAKRVFRLTLAVLFLFAVTYTGINFFVGLSRRTSFPGYLLVSIVRQFFSMVASSLLPAVLFLISGRLPPRRGVAG